MSIKFYKKDVQPCRKFYHLTIVNSLQKPLRLSLVRLSLFPYKATTTTLHRSRWIRCCISFSGKKISAFVNVLLAADFEKPFAQNILSFRNYFKQICKLLLTNLRFHMLLFWYLFRYNIMSDWAAIFHNFNRVYKNVENEFSWVVHNRQPEFH